MSEQEITNLVQQVYENFKSGDIIYSICFQMTSSGNYRK